MSYRENLIPALNGVSFEVSNLFRKFPFASKLNSQYLFRQHHTKELEYVVEQVPAKAQSLMQY